MTEKFTGKGSFLFENGNNYSGEWVEGLPDGFGIMSFDNGDTYEGDWSKGKMNGFGEYHFFDQSKQRLIEKYEGNFVDGKREGYGKMTYKNRNIYFGTWQNNMRTGDGLFIFANGDAFHGIWRFDIMIRGVFALSSGDRYDGEIKAGTFNGFGKYFWADGTWYEGTWKEGKPYTGVKFGRNGIVAEYQEGNIM